MIITLNQKCIIHFPLIRCNENNRTLFVVRRFSAVRRRESSADKGPLKNATKVAYYERIGECAVRGLVSPKGEQFGYLVGDTLYTMDDEPSGRLQEAYIVDLAGNPIWRVVGDGVYSLNGMETIGYLTAERSDSRDY